MALPREELMRTNVMSEELKEAIKKRPMPQFRTGIVEMRADRAAHLKTLRHLMPVPGPIPEVIESEQFVEATDGYQIKTIIYRPTSPKQGPGPLIVLYHEGGWSSGDLTDEEFNARLLSRELDAVCVNVEYRLAPEHPFPIGILDSWAVLKWAAKNANSIGADPSKGFIVGGSSAGGNIAAVLAHHSRNERLDPPVTGQWLSVAYLIPSNLVPDKYRDQYISRTSNHDDPVLPGVDDATLQSRIMQVLNPDMTSPLMSPVAPALYPPKGSEADSGKAPLACAYFQIAGLDPLRDHGLIYSRILREEHGVNTKVDLYSGFGHMFWTNWPEMETSKKFAQDMVNGVRWMLESGPESTS